MSDFETQIPQTIIKPAKEKIQQLVRRVYFYHDKGNLQPLYEMLANILEFTNELKNMDYGAAIYRFETYNFADKLSLDWLKSQKPQLLFAHKDSKQPSFHDIARTVKSYNGLVVAISGELRGGRVSQVIINALHNYGNVVALFDHTSSYELQKASEFFSETLKKMQTDNLAEAMYRKIAQLKQLYGDKAYIWTVRGWHYLQTEPSIQVVKLDSQNQ